MKTNLFSKELYPTPPEVIERMMMGEDFVGKTILEPSAGTGNIVSWLQDNGAARVPPTSSAWRQVRNYRHGFFEDAVRRSEPCRHDRDESAFQQC